MAHSSFGNLQTLSQHAYGTDLKDSDLDHQRRSGNNHIQKQTDEATSLELRTLRLPRYCSEGTVMFNTIYDKHMECFKYIF